VTSYDIWLMLPLMEPMITRLIVRQVKAHDPVIALKRASLFLRAAATVLAAGIENRPFSESARSKPLRMPTISETRAPARS
jgi:hypothetical protein